MTPKKLNKEDVVEIKKTSGKKGYLTKEEVSFLVKKFNFCQTVMYRELIKNKIPFQSGSAKRTMNSMGLKTDGKKINIKQLKSLPKLQLNLLKNMKTLVMFSCKLCGEESKSRIKNILNRTYFNLEPICSKCILKAVTNDEKWKLKNSQSQLIAQNLPEQKEKNRKAQKERFKNESLREKYRETWKKKWEDSNFREKIKINASDKSRKNWENPEYAKKVIENSKSNYKSGFYKEMYYQSGFELAFLLKYENENLNFDKLKRCHFGIQYEKKNGKLGHYYPDYIISEKTLIEVKGYGPWVDFDSLARKNKAAKKWCKENKMKFRIVEKNDLTYFWIKKAKIKHKELSENKI